MKKKLAFAIILITVLLWTTFNDYPLLSTAYNAVMRSDYRPVLSKDKDNLAANLNLVQEKIKDIHEKCNNIDTTSLEKEAAVKRKQIDALSWKKLVVDTHPLHKELFFLHKKANELSKNCFGEKENSALSRKKEYTLTSPEFVNYLGVDSTERPSFVKIENKGKDIIKPKLMMNGIDFSSLETIAQSIIHETMTDKEKALAIWNFVKENKYHFGNPTTYVERDSIDLLNSWGYGNCGYTTRTVVDLARLAGLPAREYRLGVHIVPEIYFEDDWHVLDADGGVYFTNDDGTIASVDDIEKDITLLNTANSSVYSYDYFKNSYGTTKNNVVFNYISKNTKKEADYSLRPQESVLFLNSNQGDYFSAVEYNEPPEYSNSFFIYQPEKVKRIIDFEYPYPLVGGVISGESNEELKIEFTNGQGWHEIYQGTGPFLIDYSSFFTNGYNIPDTSYQLRFSSDKIDGLKIITEVQTSVRALPFPEEGEINAVEFKDAAGNKNSNVHLEFGFSSKP